MANTSSRQLRRSARYASNGAVYLETALPNIVLSDFFAYDLQHYTTHAQNYKRVGLVKALAIQNAFGMSFPMTIQSSQGLFQFVVANHIQTVLGGGSPMT
ncbi:hypothetical protein H257_02928 [Aphanomyces astaci]|uniref:Uncharacterized protein n=1 Tax=Aphanomyces astaci TaxID=112090 RepID=W4H0I3_APHAT|nr:hypothetical protein H257_02928 [Aphanomyces astaci]ETV85051.1 hypothetical protein H257_02928 [Aphanomyces astaci]|eukprot:XP_009825069.1 hypothetical protein H257_02928 [Aphanomyces astaci]